MLETNQINVPEASQPVCSASLLSNDVHVENKSQLVESKPKIKTLKKNHSAFRVNLLDTVKENNDLIRNNTFQSAKRSRSIGQLTPKYVSEASQPVCSAF